MWKSPYPASLKVKASCAVFGYRTAHALSWAWPLGCSSCIWSPVQEGRCVGRLSKCKLGYNFSLVVLIFLWERQRSLPWTVSLLQVPTTAKAGPGQRWESGTEFGSPGSKQVLQLLPAASHSLHYQEAVNPKWSWDSNPSIPMWHAGGPSSILTATPNSYPFSFSFFIVYFRFDGSK